MFLKKFIVTFVAFLTLAVSLHTPFAAQAQSFPIDSAVPIPQTENSVSAQGVDFNIDRVVPFAQCGFAGFDGRDACCYYKPIEYDPDDESILDKVKNGIINLTPGIGHIYRWGKFVLVRGTAFQDLVADKKPCFLGEPNFDNSLPSDDQCTCTYDNDPESLPTIRLLCERYLNPARAEDGSRTPSEERREKERLANEFAGCVECARDGGYYSAIGCVPLNSFGGFITRYVFGFGVSLAGLIALLCIIYSAIILQTSRGDSEKIQKARENMTACILGLILIIFSVLILQLIGVLILPGL